MIRPAALAMPFLLAGCGVGAAAGAGSVAGVEAPAAFTALHDIVLGVKTLDGASKTACNMQSIANTLGGVALANSNPAEAQFYARMSVVFGKGCIW